MSLTITAYKGVKLIDKPTLDEYGDISGRSAKQVTISIGNSEWEQGDDLIKGQFYTYDDVMTAYSAPYSSYGRLRDELARIAGYEKVITGNSFDDRYPYQSAVCIEWDKGKRNLLAELLCFADSEGEIGTKTCRKILSDLKTLAMRNEIIAVKRRLHQSQDPLFETHHKSLFGLIKTFEFAAVDGFVQFA